MPIPVEERVRLYSAWLEMKNGFPLTGILWEPDIPLPRGLLKSVGNGNSLTPSNFDFRPFLGDYETWHIRESRLTHHVIHSFCPALGMPWVEALAGCPLTVHEGSIWVEGALLNTKQGRKYALILRTPGF
jgi:hypothetical protein